jgi:hypothetical protein
MSFESKPEMRNRETEKPRRWREENESGGFLWRFCVTYVRLPNKLSNLGGLKQVTRKQSKLPSRPGPSGEEGNEGDCDRENSPLAGTLSPESN